MSRAATRATAALLCGVVLVALGLAFVGLPDSERSPDSMSVEIDFDTFTPGVTQTRSSSVEVPVPSRVAVARVDTIGPDVAIDVDLTICDRGDCRPLEAGAELEPGPYTLTVAATLDDQVAPGSSGRFVGEIRIVETSQTTAIDTTLMMVIAGIGLLAIAIGALLVDRRQGVVR